MPASRLNRRLTLEAKEDSSSEEDEKKIIYEGNEQRHKNYQGFRKSYRKFLIYTFKLGTIISFIGNLNFMVLIQMCLAGAAVYTFTTFDITFDAHVSIFISPIVFPLAFSINTDFQRREKVLDDLANFKSSSMVWYFCMRDWKEAAGLDDHFLKTCHIKLKKMLFHLREYLLTERGDQTRAALLRKLYEHFSDTNQLIEKVRGSKLPANTALMSRVIHLLNTMCLSFERLRNIREYRSPRSIRSFNKVLIFFLPFILAPYFVFLGKKIDNSWSPYYIAVMASFIFGCLQGVQDKLDDPFDGMSEDDVDIESIAEWTFDSLGATVNRNFKIGRFQVLTNIETALDAKIQASSMMASAVPGEKLDYTAKLSKPENVIDKGFQSSPNSRRASRTTQSSKKNKTKQKEKSLEKTVRCKNDMQTPSFDICEAPLDQHPHKNLLEKIQGDVAIERNGHVVPNYGSTSISETPNSILELTDLFPDPRLEKIETVLETPVDTKIDIENIPTTTAISPRTLSKDMEQRKQVSFQDEQQSSENQVHPDLGTIHSEFTSEERLQSLPLTSPLIKPRKNTKKSNRFKLTKVGGHQHVKSSSSSSDANLIEYSGSKGEKPIRRQSNSPPNLRKANYSVLANNHANEKNLIRSFSQDSEFSVAEERREDEVFF